LKTDPRARYQGYSFFFREGFCWSDINTTFLKCRQKQKSINDVKSMSLYGICDTVPEYYIICIINSRFMSHYVDNFVNNTQTFQINDARQVPIIIPTDVQLSQFKKIFENAVNIKRQQFSSEISVITAEETLKNIQKKLDNLIDKLYAI
jgi:hypothetical protein